MPRTHGTIDGDEYGMFRKLVLRMPEIVQVGNPKHLQTNHDQFLRKRPVSNHQETGVERTFQVVSFTYSYRHVCQNKARSLVLRGEASGKARGKTRDDLIFTNYGYYRIRDVMGDNLSCVKIETDKRETKIPDIDRLPWSLAGVKVVTGYSTDVNIIPAKDVVGKLMLCDEFITEWFPEWFKDSKREK